MSSIDLSNRPKGFPTCTVTLSAGGCLTPCIAGKQRVFFCVANPLVPKRDVCPEMLAQGGCMLSADRWLWSYTSSALESQTRYFSAVTS